LHQKGNDMKILVIGAGNMASAFVKQLRLTQQEVSITARDPAKAQALAARYEGAKAIALTDAAKDKDVIILATPYAEAANALSTLGNLKGAVIVDITNPLTPDYMGLTLGHSSSASEEIAKAVPGAHLVKAFNTLFAQVLDQGAKLDDGTKASVFFAGDNEVAKQLVKQLAVSMGFQAIDAGGLKNARYLEPLAGLNIYFGYGASKGTGIAPTWVGAV
jgi:predicted dinucleotide-binding enzyme